MCLPFVSPFFFLNFICLCFLTTTSCLNVLDVLFCLLNWVRADPPLSPSLLHLIAGEGGWIWEGD